MKITKKIGSALFYVAILLTEGCSDPDFDLRATVSDQSYFPLRVGDYRIYEVTETYTSQASCTDYLHKSETTFELKEWIYDSIKNGEGDYTYFIHRYSRGNETQPWTDLDTWSARKNANQVIVDEGNTRYLKMVFPLKNGKWDANKYNSLVTTAYDTVWNKGLGKPYQLDNGKKYAITLTVSHDNRNYKTVLDQRREVYASMVGLIYLETTRLEFLQGHCSGQPDAQLNVESGIVYAQSLKSAGRQ